VLRSLFLGGDGIRLLEILPEQFQAVRNRGNFWLAWLIDICAKHADNARQSFWMAHDRLKAYFVDQGHLFGGPKGEQRPRFLASRYLDPRIYQSISRSNF